MRITIWKRLKWRIFGATPEELASLEAARKASYLQLMATFGMTPQEAEGAYQKDCVEQDEFLAACAARGLSFKEAQRLWKEEAAQPSREDAERRLRELKERRHSQ
ncbi:MAG: hypothetical protein L6Q92_07620 [Phycisphaerae bacterium]|nr:hypothetical protein [Phycisphaerae bacterium]